MNSTTAAAVLAAIAQPTRLDALRLLGSAGPRGLAAGTIASRLGVVASTLSHHLGQLERAGLVRSRREGRFVVYAVDAERTRQVLDYVSETLRGGIDRPLPLAEAAEG